MHDALALGGLEAGALELGVTESSLMVDAQRSGAVLDRLSAIGVRVAIDDFGTGYPSLSHLKRFSAQTLKIDRSCVRDLPHDSDVLAITRAVVALGSSLGLRIVAEGVQTEAQRNCLQALGCDALRGCLFGRPEAAEQATQRLRACRDAGPAAAA